MASSSLSICLWWSTIKASSGKSLSLPATEAVVAAADIEECCGACVMGVMLFKIKGFGNCGL